jgi:hypothetical protein
VIDLMARPIQFPFKPPALSHFPSDFHPQPIKINHRLPAVSSLSHRDLVVGCFHGYGAGALSGIARQALPLARDATIACAARDLRDAKLPELPALGIREIEDLALLELPCGQ